jgi:protein-S-isoprenylcysteine O-methyltransferase Ste14
LRLLGVNRLLPAISVHDLLPFAYVGFGINLATGLLFYVGDPHRYTINIAFQLKMLLVVLAGLNALYYQMKIHPQDVSWNDSTEIPTNVKAVGALSLVLWFGVLSYGRLIPYLGTG